MNTTLDFLLNTRWFTAWRQIFKEEHSTWFSSWITEQHFRRRFNVRLVNTWMSFQSIFSLLFSMRGVKEQAGVDGGGESILHSNPRHNRSPPAEIWGPICWFLLVGLIPGLPWPSSRCGKWSVNSLQICCGWGGLRALAGRNVTWTPLHREAALWDGALMHIVSGPNRKLTQQFKAEPAGENACWRQSSCGGSSGRDGEAAWLLPHILSWYFTVDGVAWVFHQTHTHRHELLVSDWRAVCKALTFLEQMTAEYFWSKLL